MSYKIKVGVLVTTLILVSATLGATAYTTGSVSRTANANVVTDDAGLIALESGTVGGIVQQNSSGALAIDFTAGNAQGVNTEAHFELGNPTDANNSYAFNVTNLDAEAHTFSFSYSGVTNDSDADQNIQYQLYDSSGTSLGTVSEESDVTGQTITAGETVYVVMVIDTHGLNSTADLSGTLQISA